MPTNQSMTAPSVTPVPFNAVNGDRQNIEPPRLIVKNLGDFVSPEILSCAPISEGRKLLRTASAGDEIIAKVLEAIGQLPETDTLILDLQSISLSTDLLYPVLKAVYFPAVRDYASIGRGTDGKRVIIANPDSGNLLGITQCLELAYANCMVITKLTEEPWHMLYAGHVDRRLREVIERVVREGYITSTMLAEEKGTPATKVNLGRAATVLKEIHELGFLNREKVKIEGRKQRPYRYTYYHPYQHMVTGFVPDALEFYTMPRPSYASQGKKEELVIADEKPEPGSLNGSNVKSREFRSVRDTLFKYLANNENKRAREFVVALRSFWAILSERAPDESIIEMYELVTSTYESSKGATLREDGYMIYGLAVLRANQDFRDNGVRSMALLREALSMGEWSHDAILCIKAHEALGNVFKAEFNYNEASEHYYKALELAKESCDLDEKSKAYLRTAEIELLLGGDGLSSPRKASEQLHDGQMLASLRSNKLVEVGCIALQARAQMRLGHLEAAESYALNAISLAQIYRFPKLEAWARTEARYIKTNDQELDKIAA